MKIAIGTDHNGEHIRKELIKVLENKGHTVIDISPHNTPTDDYTDYAFKVAEKIQNKEADQGILLCGTGIGMCIAANKAKGINCALVSNVNEAALSKEHNNANIISMGSQNNLNDIIKMVDVFLNSEFKNEERHVRRLNKIREYEEKNL